MAGKPNDTNKPHKTHEVPSFEISLSPTSRFASDARDNKVRPRFREIALEAGVSETTVDRVLNERGSVSAGARERVVAAALKLKVRRVLPDVRHGLLHVDVLMPYNTSPMFQRLERALRNAIQLLDRRIVVHRITLDRKNDKGFAQAISKTPYRRAGLIVVGSATSDTLAAIRTVTRSGEPVVAMVTELPGTRYVGIDNDVAGRTAGHMIGKLTRGEGRVVILRALDAYPAHDQRVDGCIRALQAVHPSQDVHVVPTETNDDPDICYRLLSEVLRSAPDSAPVSAIYNSGDGATGVHKALKRFDLLGKVVWVGHEMQDAHAEYLERDWMDLVIDQNPDLQALAALQYVLVACGLQPANPLMHIGELALFTKPNARSSPYLG